MKNCSALGSLLPMTRTHAGKHYLPNHGKTVQLFSVSEGHTFSSSNVIQCQTKEACVASTAWCLCRSYACMQCLCVHYYRVEHRHQRQFKMYITQLLNKCRSLTYTKRRGYFCMYISLMFLITIIMFLCISLFLLVIADSLEVRNFGIYPRPNLAQPLIQGKV